ncbi:hypothetical protein QAS_1020 [Clostridioides difficile CD9]|nr:hypothetical protein QAQ_2964 [Clostridioides difficile CD8]EQE06207.1 hypothetical protein QAS_1020 [Clostridioides difficile CD9]EQI96224.1 hypothetical protein QQQ_2324 [Clostridioides difficile P5]EQJ82948.1 hypothetical protein QU9_2390 [Clostridioides difficile P48]ERM36505.1 hypothetical protein QU1_0964 [Clostridioides difficile P37]
MLLQIYYSLCSNKSQLLIPIFSNYFTQPTNLSKTKAPTKK